MINDIPPEIQKEMETQQFMQLHPAVQITIVIAVAAVFCTFLYNFYKLLRDK